MSELLEKIGALRFLEKELFFHAVVDHDKIVHFLALMSQADDTVRAAVYDGLSQFWLERIQKGTADEVEIGGVEIREAEIHIQALFDEINKIVKEINAHEKEHKKMIKEARTVMKAGADAEFPCVSDQKRGIAIPPLHKEYIHTTVIDLPPPDEVVLKKPNILECIKKRKSRRKFTQEELTLKELSYLLWATQGVRKVSADKKMSYRTVPSGGARQPFETYIVVQRVKDCAPGVYWYLLFGHKVVYLFSGESLSETLTELAWGQTFVGDSAVCFMWSVIPYRSEWRYALEAKKDILQESGHICQNLYLACESIGCGTCAVGAYNQKGVDTFLKLDGEEEFVIYVAPVGKVKEDYMD